MTSQTVSSHVNQQFIFNNKEKEKK